MGKADKVLQRILRGTSDTSISFVALCNLLCRLEFEERIKGDHHTYFVQSRMRISIGRFLSIDCVSEMVP